MLGNIDSTKKDPISETLNPICLKRFTFSPHLIYYIMQFSLITSNL